MLSTAYKLKSPKNSGDYNLTDSLITKPWYQLLDRYLFYSQVTEVIHARHGR